MQVNELFSDNIKRLRSEKGFTQQQLADMAGITITALRGYENLRRAPPMETMGKIAQALGVTVADLFETGEVIKPNVLAMPISKVLQKMSCIPDNIYDIAVEIPRDHEIWRMMYHALDGIREELEDARKDGNDNGKSG